MNWKRWKLGLVIAFFGGVADAASSYMVSDTPHWDKIIAMAVIKGVAAAGLFLKQHPAESITFDTQQITK